MIWEITTQYAQNLHKAGPRYLRMLRHTPTHQAIAYGGSKAQMAFIKTVATGFQPWLAAYSSSVYISTTAQKTKTP